MDGRGGIRRTSAPAPSTLASKAATKGAHAMKHPAARSGANATAATEERGPSAEGTSAPSTAAAPSPSAAAPSMRAMSSSRAARAAMAGSALAAVTAWAAADEDDDDGIAHRAKLVDEQPRVDEAVGDRAGRVRAV